MKGFLLSHLEEKSDIVASQLAILTAKVAREDWPKAWPGFLQELTNQVGLLYNLCSAETLCCPP